MKVELLRGGIQPIRAHDDDAGIDFYSPIYAYIPPNSDILIPLNLKVELKRGQALIFKEKSGVATKKKLSVGACVIDSGYRGIVHAHLFNHSSQTQTIEAGQKIVQGIIVDVSLEEVIVVDIIESITKRGENGFGSTDEVKSW